MVLDDLLNVTAVEVAATAVDAVAASVLLVLFFIICTRALRRNCLYHSKLTAVVALRANDARFPFRFIKLLHFSKVAYFLCLRDCRVAATAVDATSSSNPIECGTDGVLIFEIDFVHQLDF